MSIATTIRQQISLGSLMSLGMQQPAALTADNEEVGFTFLARILPITKSGRRGTSPRIMRVSVTLNGNDLYDVEVTYIARRKPVTHYEAVNVGAEQISTLMLALDYDGDQVLNPRLI
ncbi:hypothetical protein [Glutamicibacter sp. ZJUTW]|uniref:hypothetical protein n=1 Tax=Glutamicibacter sp. ZJUTW TaxID=1155384 RepID=UPI0011F3E848|nr:hypothetical protein [Glutamicibacter sp. ZJUTW]QEP09085.1 hypothetical protein F0M17_17325 [Glutamicibacter sp. ZJUTW]